MNVAPKRPPIGEDHYRQLVEAVKDYAILMLDPTGVVQSWNAGVEHLKGYTAEQIIGRHFSVFYPKEALQRGWPAHELKVAAQTGRFEDEGWRVRRDGSRFWANIILTALYDGEGRVTGYSKITRDLTERRAQEEMLRESEERFRLLMEGVQDYAIFMLTPEGKIASWNAGAQSIKGYASGEVIGRHFAMFYPADAIARHWPDHALRTALDTGRFEDEGWRVRKDGSRFWANVIITALRDSKGELRGFAKLTRDLTTRRRIEELQSSEQRMNEFLAMLGHELRNPLSPLQSALDILALRPDDPGAHDMARKVFTRQVRHLTRLVDDLLDVSRITAGKVSLRFETVDFRALVEETAAEMRAQAAARGQRLVCSLPEGALMVRADTTRLSQILVNLIGNASKYTPDGGAIEVSLERVGDFAQLVVADNGMGMPPELVARIFDLFVQGSRTLDRREGGLGLGLTLVRRLVELHGGTVAASSVGVDQGSRFTVRMPLQLHEELRQTVDAAPAGTPIALRVMVIDDNADAAQSLAMLLQVLGHEVEIAYDGIAALERAPQFEPHLVLLDIGLPRMDGYEVARALRAQPALHKTVLVACTGYGHDEHRGRVKAAGFDQHLVKPVQLQDLETIIARLHQRVRAE